MGMKLETLEGSFSAVSKPILQVNTHLKALAEIYTIHTFAKISELKFSIKKCFLFLQNVCLGGLTTHFGAKKRIFEKNTLF